MEMNWKKSTIILIALSMIASVSSDDFEANAKTLYYSDERNGAGNYEYSFDTSNGISRQESGILEHVGQPDEHLRVVGSYSYVAPDGMIIQVRYEADRNGFRILAPTPPPTAPQLAAVPGQIVASLLG